MLSQRSANLRRFSVPMGVEAGKKVRPSSVIQIIK